MLVMSFHGHDDQLGSFGFSSSSLVSLAVGQSEQSPFLNLSPVVQRHGEMAGTRK